jgi:hypothetical protein
MNIVHIAFLSVMRRFFASNSLVILSLIAIKDRLWRGHAPAEESRGTGGPSSPFRHFVLGPVVDSRWPCALFEI